MVSGSTLSNSCMLAEIYSLTFPTLLYFENRENSYAKSYLVKQNCKTERNFLLDDTRIESIQTLESSIVDSDILLFAEALLRLIDSKFTAPIDKRKVNLRITIITEIIIVCSWSPMSFAPNKTRATINNNEVHDHL